MLKHYVLQALRSFWRFRITAAVNLVGLVLAVTCFIATYLFLDTIVRSDSYFPKSSRTWVITQELWTSPTSRMIPAFPMAGPPVAKFLRVDFPQLESVARAMGLGQQSAASGDRKMNVFSMAADPQFLKIFDFEFRQGDGSSALDAAHSVILTERTAQRLFGTSRAVGRQILLQNRTEVTVTGVIAAVPQPSHMGDSAGTGELQFDLIVPMALLGDLTGARGPGGGVFDPDSGAWGWDSFYTYVLFPADGSFTPKELIAQLDSFTKRREPKSPVYSVLGAVPVSRITLARLDALFGANTISLATTVSLLDLLILAIACLNYANLAVAIATTRAKEIGVRKVLGASRMHLMRQYLVEAALLAVAAVVVVLVLAVLVIEPLNRALDMNLQLSALLKPELWALVAGLIGAISLIGGAYPALVLSRVRPVEALRAGSVRAGPRFVPTILVGVQFGAASFLLVAALLITHQNRMLQKSGLQVGTDPVVVMGSNLPALGVSYDTLRTQLLRNPGIKSVTSTNSLPWMDGGAHLTVARSVDPGSASDITIYNMIGYDFFQTIGLKLLAGRLLDREHGDDSLAIWAPRPADKPEVNVVIDRALSAVLGWANPNDAVNKVVFGAVSGPTPSLPLRIVGVVETGYPRLVALNSRTNLFAITPSMASIPLVRASRENLPATLSYIDSTWDELAPKAALRRVFMDDLFNLAYQNYARISSVLSGLAMFAFFISVMGLCGLAIHVTSRRQREIGIRKTLGASAKGVVIMLLKDFAKPVLIANVVAWPFAYFLGRAYLNQFVQQVDLTIWPFVLSLVITVGIAWASVGYQALRAAAVKPANVLYAQ